MDVGSSKRTDSGRADGPPARAQLNIYLPAALIRRVKHKAIDEGTTLSAVVEQALTEYLQKHGEAAG